MWRAPSSGVGKRRHTLNQDYFKLSGSSPGMDLAARARRAFSIERARERMAMAWRRGAPGEKRRKATPEEMAPPRTLEPTEVIAGAAAAPPPPEMGATATPSAAGAVPPWSPWSLALEVGRWPIFLGWRAGRALVGAWSEVRRWWTAHRPRGPLHIIRHGDAHEA